MPTEVTKSKLIEIAESGDILEYLGDIVIGTERRLYYRTTGIEGDKPQGHLVIYIVD